MAKSWSSLAALLMVTAAVAQLMPPTNERTNAALDRDYSDRESSSEDSKDLSSYLRQVVDERNANPDSDNSKTDEDETMRRRRVELLMRLLTNYEGNSNTPDKKKRTCKVNLGGNCATEEALSMADHWHFLNSAMSPGRRRRRSAVDRSPSLSQQQQQRRRRLVED